MKIGKKKLGAAILMSLALVLCLQGIVYACVLFGYVGEGGGWGSDHTESFYAGSQNFKRQADGLGSTIPSTDGWGTFYYNLDETSPRWAWYYTSAGSSFPLNSWGRFPDLDQEGNEEQDDIAIGIIHARAAEGPRPNNMFDPHPFIYDLNGREIAFAHHGFINANGWQDTITEEVIGLNYMALPVFDRACLDDDVWEVVDSEFYGVAMMKNVLIADNYHSRYGSLDTDWAVNRTLAKIQEEMPNGYTSLNCLLQDTSSIFAVCQVTDSNHRLAVFRWWDVDVNPAEQTDNIAIMSARDPLVGAFDYYEYGDDYTGHGYYDPAFTVEDEPDGYLEDGTYTVVHSDGTVDTPSALRAFSDTPYVQNYILNEEEDGNQFNSSVAYSKYSDDDNWYEYEMGSVYQSDGKIYFRPLNQMGLFEQGEIVVFDSETREYSDPDLAFDPTTNDVYVVARSAASATPSAFKKIVMKILDFDTSVEGPADFEGNFDSASTRTWNLGGLVTIETADDEVGPPSIDFADNGKAVVVWSEQKWLDHHEVAGRIVSDGGTDGDVEYLLPAVHRTYTTLFPDIAYIGTDGTDECFAVVYNMSEAPNGTNGVYLNLIDIDSNSDLSSYKTDQIENIETDPEDIKPVVSTTFGGVPTSDDPIPTYVLTDEVLIAYCKGTNALMTARFSNPLDHGNLQQFPYLQLSTLTSPYTLYPDLDIAGYPGELGVYHGGEFEVVACAVVSGDDKVFVVKYGDHDTGYQSYTEIPTENGDDLKRYPSIIRIPIRKFDFEDGEGFVEVDSEMKRLITWTSSGVDDGGTSDLCVLANFYPNHFAPPAAAGPMSLNPGDEEVVTADEVLPYQFALHAAYPNPFNPTTTIRYDVAELGQINISVYNVIGQEVATITDVEQAAGSYAVTFDASNLTSGVYFVQMDAPGFNAVQKILLMK